MVVGPGVFVFVRVIKVVGVRGLIGVWVGVHVNAPPLPQRRSGWEVENGPIREMLEVGEGVADA